MSSFNDFINICSTDATPYVGFIRKDSENSFVPLESIMEQRSKIIRYANKNNLKILFFAEEKEDTFENNSAILLKNMYEGFNIIVSSPKVLTCNVANAIELFNEFKHQETELCIVDNPSFDMNDIDDYYNLLNEFVQIEKEYILNYNGYSSETSTSETSTSETSSETSSSDTSKSNEDKETTKDFVDELVDDIVGNEDDDEEEEEEEGEDDKCNCGACDGVLMTKKELKTLFPTYSSSYSATYDKKSGRYVVSGVSHFNNISYNEKKEELKSIKKEIVNNLVFGGCMLSYINRLLEQLDEPPMELYNEDGSISLRLEEKGLDVDCILDLIEEYNLSDNTREDDRNDIERMRRFEDADSYFLEQETLAGLKVEEEESNDTEEESKTSKVPPKPSKPSKKTPNREVSKSVKRKLDFNSVTKTKKQKVSEKKEEFYSSDNNKYYVHSSFWKDLCDIAGCDDIYTRETKTEVLKVILDYIKSNKLAKGNLVTPDSLLARYIGKEQIRYWDVAQLVNNLSPKIFDSN